MSNSLVFERYLNTKKVQIVNGILYLSGLNLIEGKLTIEHYFASMLYKVAKCTISFTQRLQNEKITTVKLSVEVRPGTKMVTRCLKATKVAIFVVGN